MVHSVFFVQDTYTTPLTSIQCWHVHCEECWLRTLVSPLTHPEAHKHQKASLEHVFYYNFFREQRSYVPSATPSPHLEIWGGSTCNPATRTRRRFPHFQPIRGGAVGSWSVIHSHLHVITGFLVRHVCQHSLPASSNLWQLEDQKTGPLTWTTHTSAIK